MTRTLLIALAWAATILGVAFAGREAIIPANTADTLVLALPVLAVVSLGLTSAKSCRGARA